MKWWEGKKTWPFIQSNATHGKCDAAHGKCDAADDKCDAAWRQTRRRWRQTRRRWRQIRRILTHFYGVTERSCIFNVTSDLTHWPSIDLWRYVYYAQLITYLWLCKLGHTPHYYSSPLMNIHDDSATSLLRDVTSLKGCDVRGHASKFGQIISFIERQTERH